LSVGYKNRRTDQRKQETSCKPSRDMNPKHFLRDVIESKWFHRATHLIFPDVCLVCECILKNDEPFTCHTCSENFDSYLLPNESTTEMMARLVQHFKNQTAIDDAIALYRFYKDESLQKVIHAFKYEGISGVAVEQGKRLGEKILEEKGSAFDVIVPMPLHYVKFIERGYNQAEKIAEGISSVLRVPVKALVQRVRNTSAQASITSLGERIQNMQSRTVFAANSDDILSNKVQRVLLVDDVFTTGSTLLACAVPLKRAGVQHLTVTTVAVTTD
jgi:ComF family protein